MFRRRCAVGVCAGGSVQGDIQRHHQPSHPRRYTFSAEGAGGLKITVNDAPVYTAAGPDLTAAPASTPAKLNKGRNTIVAEYTSPPDGGDASVRILWSSATTGRAGVADAVDVRLLRRGLRGLQRERDGRETFVDSALP